jgi:hypothetical protein
MTLPGANAYEVHELLPKFDCGQCGNPICMTFARKLLLEIQKPETCIFSTDEKRQEINRIIGDVDRKREPPAPSNGEIVEIHPCTEEGMVTLWAQLKPTCGSNEIFGDYFDQLQLCRSVSQADFFDKDECSPKMGYAYVELKGKRTHIFKTGKIIMRRADNKEDAMATLSKIYRLLLPARVCSCGNLMADCFGGCCDDCFENTCQAFSNGMDEGIPQNVGDVSTIGQIIDEQLDGLDDELKANFTRLSAIFELIERIVEETRSGSSPDKEKFRKEMDTIEDAIVKACTEVFLGASKPENTVITLAQYGLARDLIRAGEGLLGLENGKDEGLYEEVTGLLVDAYSAFENRDAASSEDIWKRYETFVSKWEKNSMNVGYAKIAANGFYISRILGKPVSDLSMFDMDKDHI